MVYESMQAYRETANNYRDWTGDYGSASTAANERLFNN